MGGKFQQNFLFFIHDHVVKGADDWSNEEKYLAQFYYEYLLHRVGAAPFTGFGASIKKGASDDRIDGMASVSYTHLTLPTNREV